MPVRTVNINNIKEFGAEAEEHSNVDYVLNARELYRLFLRSGGAPAKRPPEAFDRTWDDAEVAYKELLDDRKWSLSSEIEELEVTINGKKCKCAVAANLGQVRRLLEGEYRKNIGDR